MCNDYTLFEKSSSTKLVLDCFQELCELIHSSWIYEFIKKRRSKGEFGKSETSLIEVIESGMNYGKVAIVIDDTSSDESSCSSESVELISPPPLLAQSIPSKTPSPVNKQTTCTNLVQSTPEKISIISNEPVITTTTTATVSTPTRPPLVQFPVQSQMPSTSKLLTPQPQSFIKYPTQQPVRLASPVKSIMTPMKLQAATAPSTPQIYSVMYTGSGNKITLKRKPPDDAAPSLSPQQLPAITSIPPQVIQQSQVPILPVPITNNAVVGGSTMTSTTTTTTILKTDNNVMKQSSNVIPPPVTTNQLVNSSNNEKRRGCRCGNATAAPGKLTCCGQRCPCYVDSKACIDCKCRGCRNPHFIDGHKKV